MRKQRERRVEDKPTPPEDQVMRFPHVLGGGMPLRGLTAAQRLGYLRGVKGQKLSGVKRFLALSPAIPIRREPFTLRMRLPKSKGKVAAWIHRSPMAGDLRLVVSVSPALQRTRPAATVCSDVHALLGGPVR